MDSRNVYIPEGRLSSYVKYIWCVEDYAPASDKERVLPSGASQLIINLGNTYFRHFGGPDQTIIRDYDYAVVSGSHTRHIFLDSHCRASTMGVVLEPAGVPALLQIPADEFRDQVISLKAIWGAEISELREHLIETPNPEMKFRLLDSFLVDHLEFSFEPKPAIIYSVEQLKRNHGMKPVTEILDETGYSHRWFSQTFQETVGLPPKKYARLCRFQHILRLIRNRDIASWTDLALAGGYYDQSHLIHDFKSFAGISPTQYFDTESSEINHLPE